MRNGLFFCPLALAVAGPGPAEELQWWDWHSHMLPHCRTGIWNEASTFSSWLMSDGVCRPKLSQNFQIRRLWWNRGMNSIPILQCSLNKLARIKETFILSVVKGVAGETIRICSGYLVKITFNIQCSSCTSPCICLICFFLYEIVRCLRGWNHLLDLCLKSAFAVMFYAGTRLKQGVEVCTS